MNKMKIMNEFVRISRTGIDRETEIRLTTFRRQCDEADAGFGRSFLAFVQNRNMTAFGPGPRENRNERKIPLIP